MIISASRRTDIPAFYSEWLMSRIDSGWVSVPNPYNTHQISRVSLKSEDVDAIVFWTKNAEPMFEHLPTLDNMGYRYYFHYTITAYADWLEPDTGSLKQSTARFVRLSEALDSKSRVIWRYDPILFAEGIDENYHFEMMERISGDIAGYSDTCTISFVDLYKKTRRNLCLASPAIGPTVTSHPPNMSLREFASKLSAIAGKRGFRVATCGEEVDLREAGINPGRCVDWELLQRLFGYEGTRAKDPRQRPECGCTVSRDIGMYDSCGHGCAFCYATSSPDAGRRNLAERHHPLSHCQLGRGTGETSQDANRHVDDQQLKLGFDGG